MREQMKEGKIAEVRSTHGSDEKWIQKFGGSIWK